MDESILNSNFLLYRKKLETVCDEDLSQFFDDLGELIKNATFSSIEESGLAYDGSFVIMVLKNISKYAFKLNEMLNEDLKVDTKSLIKVCLLHHISKIFLYKKTKDEWKKSKGMIYEYNETNNALKGGLKSVSICLKYGIKFTEEEIEAMTIMDRDDEQSKYYSSMLSVLVKESNELSYYINKNLYKLEK